MKDKDDGNKDWVNSLKFDDKGLIPAIVQDVTSGEVLMMAYMNREALERTLATGRTWFWSRSRGELWNKGATSGHYQEVREIVHDCDRDTLLVRVNQQGVACHEGQFSCFHYPVAGTSSPYDRNATVDAAAQDVFSYLASVLAERKRNPRPGSYTSSLFARGRHAILKKIGEESAEVVMASRDGQPSQIVHEVADLWFHTLVLLAEHGLSAGDIILELRRRMHPG